MYKVLPFETLGLLDRIKLIKEFYDEGSFRIVELFKKADIDFDDYETYCFESMDDIAPNVTCDDLFYEDDEDITEALAMERYLVSRGIDKEQIIKEENSRNTHENMVFSREIIESRGGGSVAIISSDYHLYRARRLAENAGLFPVMIPAETTLPILFVNCTLREAFALVKAHLVFM